MKTQINRSLLLGFFAIFPLQGALAADGATILFQDGVVTEIRDGYKQLLDGMRERARGEGNGPVIEINLDGTPFFVDMAQVVVLCKDPCRSFKILKQERN